MLLLVGSCPEPRKYTTPASDAVVPGDTGIDTTADADADTDTDADTDADADADTDTDADADTDADTDADADTDTDADADSDTDTDTGVTPSSFDGTYVGTVETELTLLSIPLDTCTGTLEIVVDASASPQITGSGEVECPIAEDYDATLTVTGDLTAAPLASGDLQWEIPNLLVVETMAWTGEFGVDVLEAEGNDTLLPGLQVVGSVVAHRQPR